MKFTYPFFCLAFVASPIYAENFVVDIPPLAALLSDPSISGASIPDLHLSTLIEPDQDLHHFSLKPSQIRKIKEADTIIYSGETVLAGFAEDMRALNPEVNIIAIDQLIEPFDPHYWLTPQTLLKVLLKLKTELKDSYPLDAELVKTIFKAHMQFSNWQPKSELASTHDIFSHLASSYPFPYLGAINDEHDLELGARSLSEFLEQIDSDSCVVNLTLEPNPELEEIAKNKGATLTSFDHMGYEMTIKVGTGFYEEYYQQLQNIVENCQG